MSDKPDRDTNNVKCKFCGYECTVNDLIGPTTDNCPKCGKPVLPDDEELEPQTSCDLCGKDLFDGEEAYATALGYISKEVNGFTSGEDSPWLTVACAECGEKISEAVEKLIKEGEAMRKPNVKAVLKEVSGKAGDVIFHI